MQQLTEILADHEIKPTAMRLLVLRSLLEANSTLSLRELENILHPADRSTIFRTLSLFEQHHLVHTIDDGSGSVRYEACLSKHDEGDDDRHLHFRCLQCGRTICLTEHKIPLIALPSSYQVHEVKCVITGRCPECTKKHTC